MAACFAFGGFVLDTRERRLMAGDGAVELNARYFDALALLVGSQGQLVHKDRFMAEVWRGIPVTDEALTQCIRTLRRQLGDQAGRPRFIETVPKHGYRFIAPVSIMEETGGPALKAHDEWNQRWREFLITLAAGVAGGGVAGVIGGLIYGFAAASEPMPGGPGAISALLVLVSVTSLVALIGAAGVSLGIAVARLARPESVMWSILAGAAGGVLVGGFGKLLGLDAFTLLVGRSPGNITGAGEGALVGASVGLAAWLAWRRTSLQGAIATAAASGTATGILIQMFGGRLMLGSLELLASGFPSSRFRLDELTGPFAEPWLNRFAHVADAAAEVGLFSVCVLCAMLIARDRFVSRADG